LLEGNTGGSMPLPLTGVTVGRSGMLKCFKFEQQKLQTSK